MANVIMKAPAAMAASTTVILQDGTSTAIDAFGYITVDSKYVPGQLASGFLPVNDVQEGLTANKYTAMTDTTAATVTAAALTAQNAVINMTGTLGAGATLTMPTVAQLAAALPEWNVGETIRLRVINSGAGNFAWTLTTATGWGTLLGTQSVAQNSWRDFIMTFQSSTTGTVQAVGTGTQS